MYLGYFMDYNSFDSIINIAIQNNITHILLQFIVLEGELTELTFYDTIANWQSFSSEQQIQLRTKIETNGMQLMASFGGATSFANGFQLILDSPTYSDPRNLAGDLVQFCYNNNIPGLDLNIEHFPTISVYQNIKNLAIYAGELSYYIKEYSSQTFGFPIPVSHGPQISYFNNETWGYVYNQIEQFYGSSIDFYNIQYYNQGDYYTNYTQLFLNDTKFKASVYQLINASKISPSYANIPVNKIVVGKATEEETYSGGFVRLYKSDDIVNTMAGFVEQTKYDTTNPDIIDWNKQGGIMVWLYRSDNPNNIPYSEYPSNIELMNYFKYVSEYA
jgi:hypothetical protein